MHFTQFFSLLGRSTQPGFIKGDMLDTNQTLSANYENLILGHRIYIQKERRRGWEEEFVKVWLSNSRAGPDCKII